ncbi:MAG TPA: translation initiation factor IF-2 N-terminal domain-containing protein, partial [Gemmatimonadota bacterium]|nr:translation initiation factor IF-2 N-terminal domain-containing protein [Gemmatimonadota bacterium]
MANKHRIYEVARRFDVSSEAMVNLLKEMDLPVKNHMSSIDDETVERVRAKFESEKEAVKHAEGEKKKKLEEARRARRVQAREQAEKAGKEKEEKEKAESAATMEKAPEEAAPKVARKPKPASAPGAARPPAGTARPAPAARPAASADGGTAPPAGRRRRRRRR